MAFQFVYFAKLFRKLAAVLAIPQKNQSNVWRDNVFGRCVGYVNESPQVALCHVLSFNLSVHAIQVVSLESSLNECLAPWCN